MTVTLYTKQGCSTCTDAKKHLKQLGVAFVERELFKQPLDEDEIRDLLGERSASELISTKSPRFKAMGLVGKPLSDEERITLMASEPYLIRRPSFKIGQELVIGLDKERLEQLLPAGV